MQGSKGLEVSVPNKRLMISFADWASALKRLKQDRSDAAKGRLRCEMMAPARHLLRNIETIIELSCGESIEIGVPIRGVSRRDPTSRLLPAW